MGIYPYNGKRVGVGQIVMVPACTSYKGVGMRCIKY